MICLHPNKTITNEKSVIWDVLRAATLYTLDLFYFCFVNNNYYNYGSALFTVLYVQVQA